MSYQQQLIELNEKTVCEWAIYPNDGVWVCFSINDVSSILAPTRYTGTTESEAVYAAYIDQLG